MGRLQGKIAVVTGAGSGIGQEAARAFARTALFFVGAAALMLLFTGIHNAWDMVTHLVFVEKRGNREAERNRSS